MHNGKKVSHIIPYSRPQQDEAVEALFMENRKRISISGVQEKLSFVLEKNALRLIKEGEQGTYILKPILRDLKKIDQVPANEHLTMQIAKQVFFSLMESSCGDYLLIPAYDLVNTKIHVDDTDFALDNGLFSDGFISEEFKKTGHVAKSDFVEFARRIGVTSRRVEKLIAPFLSIQTKVLLLIRNSFFNEATKRGYLLLYHTKLNYLMAG